MPDGATGNDTSAAQEVACKYCQGSALGCGHRLEYKTRPIGNGHIAVRI